VLLLENLGMIEGQTLWSLWRFAPLLLVLAGIDLIFGRSWPAVGAILGLGLMAAFVLLLAIGPQRGWLPNDSWSSEEAGPPAWLSDLGLRDVKHSNYAVSRDGVEIAEIDLDLGAPPTEVHALDDSDQLIVAEIDHDRDIEFDVSGGDRRHIKLYESPSTGFTLGYRLRSRRLALWDIGLSPEVPIELAIDASSGDVSLDLQDLDVRELSYEASSGELDARLPASIEQIDYDASSGAAQFILAPETETEMHIAMSSGALEIEIDEDSSVEITVEDASSGEIRIAVPDDTEIKVDVRDDSSGEIVLPNHVERLSKDGDDVGVWRTEGYEDARDRVTIVVKEMSSGNLVVETR